jgi:two-component sensor histidine kinase
VSLSVEGEPGEWGPGVGLAVYRIVQEALTNTLKHAGARATAQVRLRYGHSGVDVEVTDDDVPRPQAATGRDLVVTVRVLLVDDQALLPPAVLSGPARPPGSLC